MAWAGKASASPKAALHTGIRRLHKRVAEAAQEGAERASSAALVGEEGVTHSSLKSGVSDAGIKIGDLPLPKYTRR